MLMQRKLFVCALLAASGFSAFAGSYRDDSLAVREILDANGLDTVAVEDVSSTTGSRISSLNISRRGIFVLPECLGVLDSLTTLGIDNNRLTALPQSIGDCASLRCLYAYDNELHALPPTIVNCTELDMLYLIRNRFTKWPSVISSMKKLKTIDLGGNHLTEVPAEISTYPQKLRLYINDNYLSELPDEFLSMQPEVIHVAGNLLCSLTEEMEAWLDTYDYYKEEGKWRIYQGCDRQEQDRSVVQKVLDQNGLGNLPVDSVVESAELGVVTLDLSAEKTGAVKGLVKKTFRAKAAFVLPADIDSLKSLRTLDLSGNRLEKLPDEFHRLFYITSLDISENDLTELPEYLLSFSNLEQLDVSGNSLSALPAELDAWLTALDPDWKETQQSTGLRASADAVSCRSVSMRGCNFSGATPVFHLNMPHSAQGTFTLYSLNGKMICSTGIREFKGKEVIRFKKNMFTPGTCLAVLQTSTGVTSFTFAMTH